MLYRGARILIMDEPTAVLAPQEADDLFATLRSMTARGPERRLHQPQARRGPRDRRPGHGHAPRQGHGRGPAGGRRDEGRPRPADGRPDRSSRPSIGRRSSRARSSSRSTASSATNDRGLPALRGVSLDVRAGEIVGIAAVAGNGQSELAEVITGLRPCGGDDHGRRRGGRQPNRPGSAIARGVAHVPEDRTGGRQRPEPVAHRQPDHEALPRGARRPRLADRRSDGPDDRRRASRRRTRSRRPSIDTQARLLSGGNLQRLILAREIETKPGLLIAVQPTRGLDVGAIETVHRLLLELRESGAAILLISEELDEILALADRIDVMYEGRIVGVVRRRGRRRSGGSGC